MSNATPSQDPLEFLKGMWSSMGFSLPGMVTPTLDVNELDKRIADLKAVEGWLKMNLNMLQMSIQALEMQRTTLAAMAAIGQSATQSEPADNPFAKAALWPWHFMQQATAPGAPSSGPAPDPPPESKPQEK